MIILVILNYEIGYRRDNKARVREKWFECQPVRSYDQQRKDVGISSFQASIYWYRFVVSDLHVLNVDLFSLFSEKLREENDIIGACHSQKTERVSSKRKIMLEVELDDEEYQKMIQKALNI